MPGAVGLVASNTRGSRFPINNDWKQFSPRIGLAYQKKPNTVFSAGYGIFWLPNDIANLPYSDPIVSSTTNIVSSINNGLTPANNISNPFPQGLVAPVGRGANFEASLQARALQKILPITHSHTRSSSTQVSSSNWAAASLSQFRMVVRREPIYPSVR